MKNTLILLSLCLPVIFTSCSKNEGCTDRNATNFDAAAEENCNCCTYEGQLVFWYGQSVATFLSNNGYTSLTYYVDGSIVGSSAANVYWTGAPDCGQNSSITVTKDLGESKSKAYEFEVKDQTGEVIWSGIRNWEANKCIKLELTE